MRLIVVRHAQAEPKRSWSGEDDDRPLIARGRRQANRLSIAIRDQRVDRIFASPALRCLQTVEPMARELDLEVELVAALRRDAGSAAHDFALSVVRSGTGTALLCSHREVMTGLLPSLSATGHELTHRPPGAKGGSWILEFRAGRLRAVEYRPPAA